MVDSSLSILNPKISLKKKKLFIFYIINTPYFIVIIRLGRPGNRSIFMLFLQLVFLRSCKETRYGSPCVCTYRPYDESLGKYESSYEDCEFFDSYPVRPAVKLSDLESSSLKIKERLIKYDFPWIYLGDNLAIAEVPIASCMFNSKTPFTYETSEIRQFLKDWLKKRM